MDKNYNPQGYDIPIEIEKRTSILVVDDSPIILKTINNLLKEDHLVHLAPSGKIALKFLENHSPDLILLDVLMPELDGYEVLDIIMQREEWKEIPVIFLTGLDKPDNEQMALDKGAVDYLLKPPNGPVLRAKVQSHVEISKSRKPLKNLVIKKTADVSHLQDAILDIVANITELRDVETGAHVKRTTSFVECIVDNLLEIEDPEYFISKTEGIDIIRSAKLHDIGKNAIPDNILNKPGRLDELEYDIIKFHTLFGGTIIEQTIKDLGGGLSDFLSVAKDVVLSHHEKWDGSGYPYGLKGNDIPLSGRIMAIAYVYDALISDRPYKKGMPHKKAMDIILSSSGSHFDPRLIELSMPVFPVFEERTKEIGENTGLLESNVALLAQLKVLLQKLEEKR